jgi:hypothetical protein
MRLDWLKPNFPQELSQNQGRFLNAARVNFLNGSHPLGNPFDDWRLKDFHSDT